MKRRLLFGAITTLLLGSATPPMRALGPAPASASVPAPADSGATDRLFAAGVGEAPNAVGAPPTVPTILPPPPAASEPATQAHGGVSVLVSIPQQRAYVFQGGVLVASSSVSTGKPGHETPTGTFRILQKQVHHRSNRYSNAPMPYMQRLTNYGVALHAGHLPGYPASHGCIRLPRGFAKRLYSMTDFGTKVTVTGRRLRPRKSGYSLS